MMLPIVLASMLAASDPCNQPPRLVKMAALQYPEDTAFIGSGLLEVIVKVSIDETGKPVKADIIESSGYDVFDDALVHAVESSTFAPAEVACSPAPSFFIGSTRFINKYTPDPDTIVMPTFTFPDGWKPSVTTAALPGMNTIADYTYESAHVLIVAERPKGEFDGSASAQQIISALHVAPVNVQSGPMTICSGFQQGWSEDFEYADGTDTSVAELLEVNGANGWFSLLYTKPKNAHYADAIDKAIDRFCVQGAPRATPHNLGMPVG
jgi:TonB family protein